MLRFSDHTAGESLARLDRDASGQAATALTLATSYATVEAADLTPFLDEILGRLRSIPADMHGEIRQEMRAHLDSLIAAHEELGLDRADATIAAIGQFGDSRQIARRYRQAWQRTESSGGQRAAMRDALATFGGAMTILLSVHTVTFNALFSVARTNAAEIRMLLTLGMLGTLGLLLPILAGIRVGRRSPRYAASSALVALLPLSAFALPLLHWDGVAFPCYSRFVWTVASLYSITGLASLVWLPVGTIAALITSLIIRRRQKGV